jgi:hypothetical protein
MNSIHQEIEKQVRSLKPGTFVFPNDFRGVGTEDAVRKALSRLTREKHLERLAHGIYYIPKTHQAFGILLPSMEEIAQAVAEHEHVRIRPTGAYALNKLGLSTQVPANQVYITDGQPRQIRIGSGSIKFKPTTPKKFGTKGPISSLLIQALETIDLDKITPEMKGQIADLLKKEKPENFAADIKLASARVGDFLFHNYLKLND